MREDDADLPEERVRRRLARLGADADSAPEVPESVRNRIAAALRAAPPPAHTTSVIRPRFLAVLVGIGAVVAAIAIGLAFLLRNEPAAPRFPSGPTAETMTVSPAQADTPKPEVTRP
ncbi:hypothetical protein [Mycolicibacterium sp. 120270]|uniref:hypothetical protein n=1 Tax=Mycolicibacterium sp. 120270 TaxID=3090600 RepID=UPI00299D21D8|nr:hypothetical protein [Mycolicibacterium sp. 120270]MDX1882668.1 hypothetical protein [Mycolicibacterium sp. 120270]